MSSSECSKEQRLKEVMVKCSRTKEVVSQSAHIKVAQDLALIIALSIILLQELHLLALLSQVMIVMYPILQHLKITLGILMLEQEVVTEQLYIQLQLHPVKAHAMKLQILLDIRIITWELGVFSNLKKSDSII
jgi:hypothetical protein